MAEGETAAAIPGPSSAPAVAGAPPAPVDPETPPPVLIALANPRSARALMRVGLAVATARRAPIVIVSVAPAAAGPTARATPAVRRMRALVHRMRETAATHGWGVRGVVRAARTTAEGLISVVREEANPAAGPDAPLPLLVVGWPAGEALGLVGLLAAAPPCDLLFVRGPVPPRWDTLMLAQRGGPHTRLAQEVALDLATVGAPPALAPHAERAGPAGTPVLTALHVAPDYLERSQEAVEEAAFNAFWTREQPVATRPRVVRARVAAETIMRESRNQDVLILDAAPTARPYPFPLGRTVHDLLSGSRVGVVVAKSAAPDGAVARLIAPPQVREEGASGAPSSVDRWFAEHTYGTREFGDPVALAANKSRLGMTIGVVLLTLDDEETIGPLLSALHADVGRDADVPLVDEILVVDGGSTDDTIAVARGLGATALDSREILRAAGSYRGRGETLWKAADVAASDLLVFLNPGGTTGVGQAVCALAGPLLLDADLHMVAGFSRRSLRGTLQQAELAGELVVRPLLNLVFPELAGLITPVPADYSIRRASLRGLPVVTGDGVEVGLLLDILRHHGLAALAQVDLENRPPRVPESGAASRFAFAAAQVVLRRLDQMHTEVRLLGPLRHVLRLPHLQENGYGLEAADVPEIERPPLDPPPPEEG